MKDPLKRHNLAKILAITGMALTLGASGAGFASADGTTTQPNNDQQQHQQDNHQNDNRDQNHDQNDRRDDHSGDHKDNRDNHSDQKDNRDHSDKQDWKRKDWNNDEKRGHENCDRENWNDRYKWEGDWSWSNHNDRVTIYGKVTSIDGDKMTVSDGNWRYRVDISDAKLLEKDGGDAKQSKIDEGNKVIVRGTRSNGHIDAQFVRDLSL